MAAQSQSFNLLGFVPLLLMPAIMLVSGILFRDKGSGPEPPEGDDGGGGGGRGGGGGPDPPPGPPARPRGDLPLPDAEQGRYRLRDHNRPAPGRAIRARRPAREPQRAPSKLPR